MEENSPRGAGIAHTLTPIRKEATSQTAKVKARARVKDRGMGASNVEVPITSRSARN